MMELEKLDTSNQFDARVVSSERITPENHDEIRELVLDLNVSDIDIDVGQSLAVLAPGQEEFGQEHHLRLYSVADLPGRSDEGKPRIKICVKRCSYIDDYSGERYEGVASNYLCDLAPGETVTMTGPVGLPFKVPPEEDANVILIATSTGIAPFRAFVRHLFEKTPFRGRVWLFYGAKTGLDMVYLNDKADDFTQYYDSQTFEAFKALSPRLHFGDAIDWGATIRERGKELWKMFGSLETYVYVAGLAAVASELDAEFTRIAGSEERWKRRKAEMVAGGRWIELLY
ncbi:MAG: ferredoxin-NADP reductase [Deltaproteobacteria bacterium]|nr:ferredoxin-NADP reductase [Deltaproteobacteria bacterium]